MSRYSSDRSVIRQPDAALEPRRFPSRADVPGQPLAREVDDVDMCPADGESPILGGILLGAALLGGCKNAPSAATTTPIQIAAASDLALAFEEMGKLFEARTGEKVTFSFGASGLLAKQLGQGAPFDLFAAANSSFVDSAVRSGACDAATKATYARGHVVLWTRKGSLTLRSLADLRRPDVKHLAIANPEHAPYGKAAKEALTRAGLWAELEPKIVQAENVRQALQFAQTGNADAALVALSLVLNDDAGVTVRLDPHLHSPIEQMLVVCRRGHNAAGAQRFARLVASVEGRRILTRYGFGTSAEEIVE
ncbi:MAG: Molybdenum transporter, periplasmic molybdenum-binding protein ModA [Polyangiaceae bacterium]|nr:Molybdenum transporter, periplasmic molybdenum-binding protein ModA [Polyangiaceae bacterium]